MTASCPARLLLSLFTGALALCAPAARADDPDLPEKVDLNSFQHVFEAPPFRRLLSVSDRLVLSGVAELPETEMITVLNPETRETFVVTRTPNPRGWRLVELHNDPDLLKVSATISAAGREITLRFDPQRLQPRSSRSRAEPGREDEIQVVLEALLRRIDPVAAASFESLEPRGQEEFRTKFAAYLSAYPESSDANKADFVRETLGELAPDEAGQSDGPDALEADSSTSNDQ